MLVFLYLPTTTSPSPWELIREQYRESMHTDAVLLRVNSSHLFETIFYTVTFRGKRVMLGVESLPCKGYFQWMTRQNAR